MAQLHDSVSVRVHGPVQHCLQFLIVIKKKTGFFSLHHAKSFALSALISFRCHIKKKNENKVESSQQGTSKYNIKLANENNMKETKEKHQNSDRSHRGGIYQTKKMFVSEDKGFIKSNIILLP